MTNAVEHYGYPADTTFGEMVNLAIANKCTAITKNGGGKWYLKGQGKEYEETRSKAEEAEGETPRKKVWVIKFDK